MSQVPKPSTSGPRPAGIPSAAQHRVSAGAASIHPQPQKSPQLVPAAGPLKKTLNTGSIHFTDDTENFIVGDRVWVSGTKGGKIMFIGETKFAAGEWAGIVLDDPGTGKNDGSVGGVQYFQCEKNRGVFVRLHKLSRVPLSQEEIETVKMQTMSAATSVGSISHAVMNEFKSPDSGGGSTPGMAGVKVGQRVWLSGDRAGIVRFLGKPHFKEGIWAGIELDEPSGKNDGSVDNQRYFQCKPNHGVFAPIAKVSRAPIPSSTDEPRTPNSARGLNFKRSPSQESLHSNFSVTSAISRRSSAVRLGMSSLAVSPSTITVGRTGTGTPAEIQKAHQEKDATIANLTRERDLALKELAAKSNQERDVHTEIQKLQEQYVGALSAQDVRIQELSDALKIQQDEREKLRGELDDSRKKVEDLEFRLEEELTTRESDTENNPLQAVLDAKNREISGLQSDMSMAKEEVSRHVASLALKDDEIEHWKQAADGRKFQNSEIADDRDRIAFEVADLNRQLRDVMEKHRIELSTIQLTLQETLNSEGDLKKQIEMSHEEAAKLRGENAALREKVETSSTGIDTAVADLQQQKEDIQTQLERTTGLLSAATEDAENVRAEFDNLQLALAQKRDSLARIFREFGDLPGPQAFEEEIPALNQLLASIQLGASQRVEETKLQLSDAVRLQNESRADVTKVLQELERQKTELAISNAKLADSLTSNENLVRGTEDLNRKLVELQGDLDRAVTAGKAADKEFASVSSMQKSLDDKTKEIESLVYRLLELDIEHTELITAHQALLQRSQQELANSSSLHHEELIALTKTQQAELDSVKSSFKTETVPWEIRLQELTAELDQAQNEKAKLNQEIGRFIDVLRTKDDELKDARNYIETTFAKEEAEKAELTVQLENQQRKFEQLEGELKTLAATCAASSQEVISLGQKMTEKDRELKELTVIKDQLSEREKALLLELDQSRTAFAEQMMLAEVRRDEQIRQLINERDNQKAAVAELEMKIDSLSAHTAAEVDSVRDQLSERLKEANSQISLQVTELESTRKELGEAKGHLGKSKEEFGKVLASVQVLEVRFQAVLQERDKLAGEKEALQTQLSGQAQAITELGAEVEKVHRWKVDQGRDTNDLRTQLEESRELVAVTKKAADDSKIAFAEQMALAQVRLEELEKTFSKERSALDAKLKELEYQISITIMEGAGTLDSIRAELQQRLSQVSAESDAKTTSIISLESDLANLREKYQVSESTGHDSRERLHQAEIELARLTRSLEDTHEFKKAARDAIESFQGLPERLVEFEAQLTQRTADLAAAQAHIAAMESRYADSVRQSQHLAEEVELRKSERAVLEESGKMLEDRIVKLQRDLVEGRVSADEMVTLRSELREVVRERDVLRMDCEQRNKEFLAQQAVVTRMDAEIKMLHAKGEDSLKKEKSAVQLDDRSALDLLLTKELDRLKSDVDAHRRIIEQKDSEISHLKRHTPAEVTVQKSAEISVSQSQTVVQPRKSVTDLTGSGESNNDFQVRMLNSIIADQQNKINHLEKQLKDNVSTSILLLHKEPSEPKIPPVRRPIRLYCATCQQFDLHDSSQCPKLQAGSPERERKPKSVVRPRRKYCDECEVFDQHESRDCPVLLKKNPSRPALKTTGISVRDNETY